MANGVRYKAMHIGYHHSPLKL
jgi:hypothetical protein